jgi:hypothetical protein
MSNLDYVPFADHLGVGTVALPDGLISVISQFFRLASRAPCRGRPPRRSVDVGAQEGLLYTHFPFK